LTVDGYHLAGDTHSEGLRSWAVAGGACRDQVDPLEDPLGAAAEACRFRWEFRWDRAVEDLGPTCEVPATEYRMAILAVVVPRGRPWDDFG
jgi:hypothetical protein